MISLRIILLLNLPLYTWSVLAYTIISTSGVIGWISKAQVTKNSHWRTREYIQQQFNETFHWTREDYPRLELQVISDLLTESVHTKYMNYLFFNVGHNIECTTSSCEKYSGSRRELKLELENRGKRLDVQDIASNYPQLNQMRMVNSGSSNKNVVITKFSSFTKVEQGTLSVIGEYNMEAYIMIITDNDIIFDKVKQYVLTEEMFNTYILKKEIHQESYKMFEICAFCKSGITEIKLINYWNLVQGFRNQVKYTSSFKGEFFGAHLRVGVRLRKPTIYAEKVDGRAAYTGSDYILIQTIARSLNFQIVIKEAVDGKQCMNRKKVIPVGFCRMLLKKKVDISGFPTTLYYKNFPYVKPTAIYYITSRFIISANTPLKMQWTSMVSSVDPVVLVLIIVSYLALTHLYWAVSKFYYNECNVEYIDALLIFFSILCLEGVRLHQLRPAQMLKAGVWIVTCYSVISVIIGEITSIASSPDPSRKQINSVADMATNKVSWVIDPFWGNDVGLRKHPRLQDVKKRKKIKKRREGLQYVLSNPNAYVYYGIKKGVEPIIRRYFLSGKDVNPFHFSPPVDVPYLVTILVRNDAPYRDAITKKLLQVNAAALYTQKFIPDTMAMYGKDIKAETVNKNTFQPVGMENMFIGFLICVVGWMLSGCAFFIELTVRKVKDIKIQRKIKNEPGESGQIGKSMEMVRIEVDEIDQQRT